MKIFENYELSDEQLNKIKTFEGYEKYIKDYRQRIGEGFQLPRRQFKTVLNNIYKNDKTQLAEVE